MSFIKTISKLLGSKGAGHGDAEPMAEHYEAEREIAHTGTARERLTLAQNTRTHKEILYYLAENDPEDIVRKAVAGNESTPVQAAPFMAMDTSQDVRMALAERLVRLLPDVDCDRHSQAYAFVVQALGTLALDHVLVVRKALSSAIKDCAYAPPKIAMQLARDIEREVSEPILRYCAALSDEDLIALLAEHPEDWVAPAIARREAVSEDVSKAVVDARHTEGVTALLINPGAQITEALLSYIVETSRQIPEWQSPVATFAGLSAELARELAGFVDQSVRDVLAARQDLDETVREDIASTVQRRVAFTAGDGRTQATGVAKLQDYVQTDRLDEGVIADALAMHDYEFVKGALAHLADITMSDVERVLSMKSPKAIVALTWKAGLGMRMALALQKDPAKIDHRELLYPKDGEAFPLSLEELKWQIEFLDLD